jgi:hypothetical protein
MKCSKCIQTQMRKRMIPFGYCSDLNSSLFAWRPACCLSCSAAATFALTTPLSLYVEVLVSQGSQFPKFHVCSKTGLGKQHSTLIAAPAPCATLGAAGTMSFHRGYSSLRSSAVRLQCVSSGFELWRLSVCLVGEFVWRCTPLQTILPNRNAMQMPRAKLLPE